MRGRTCRGGKATPVTLDLRLYRDLIPQAPGRVNLNAGTLSPTPRPVLEATTALREQMAINGTEFFWRTLPPLLQTSRGRLADFLRADASRLLLLPNVTFAMNVAIASLPLSAGDEVLATDQCYGAMLLSLNRRARAVGATVRQIELPLTPASPSEIVERFSEAITPKTRALFFSHVTSATGLILPAAELCAVARERSLWSIVDGAHAPGMVELDLSAIGADYYGANCHKWLMGAPGSGFLYCTPRAAEGLEPVVVSWGEDYGGNQASDDSGWGGSMWHKRFEYLGVYDRCPQATLPTALELREQIGENRIARRVKELTAYARDRLTRAGLTCRSPDDARLTGAMLLFDWKSTPDPTWANVPWAERGIECPVTHVGDRYFIRVSCAWFNTEAEIDALAAALGPVP